MCSVSNKIIEEAMARVKADCSIDNIRHLADTIKKYRPESSEEKHSQSFHYVASFQEINPENCNYFDLSASLGLVRAR